MPWLAEDATYWAIDNPKVENNALLIADILYSQDYDPKTIAAILGNVMHEGTMNPWIWEGGTPTYTYFINNQSAFDQRGYGLFQYTNPNKYINSNNQSLPGYDPHFSDVQGSPGDGEAQVIYMYTTIDNEWTTSQYGYYRQDFLDTYNKDISDFMFITIPEFVAGEVAGSSDEEQIENLTGAFELCWERPRLDRAVNTYSLRVNDAITFYQLLLDHGFNPKGKFNLMYYLKPWWKGRI